MAIYDPNSNQHSDGSDSIAQAKPYKRMKTIDCTPTWEGLLPMLLELYEAKAVKPAKRQETRKEMAIELRRMAQAADKWNAHVKDTAESI